MFPSYLEVEKTGSQLFRALTNTVAAIWREKKVDPCLTNTIWRPKNVVHNYQELGKRL